MFIRKVKIAGTGIGLPKTKISDREMDHRLGLREGWVRKKSSVVSRYFIEHETASQLGAKAAYAALEAAGLTFKDMDCLVCASGTMEQPIPCTASLIQEAMGEGESGVPSFDINSTCLSFVTGLDVMSYMVDAGRYRRVLLVSTEVASKGLNWKQKESAALFGDGAAAAVIEQAGARESSRILHAAMETYSVGARLSEIRGGGSRLHASEYSEERADDYLFDMQGEAIFRMASKLLPGFLNKILEATGTDIRDFKLVIPHQGSALAMKLLSRKLGISEEQLMFTTPEYGNTIASSIPIGLHEAIRQQRIERGDRVLLLGTSAGLSLGGVVLDY
ncbi:beta-ketoacyl-ACP synthase III [Paenibacillus eucommiae]|uniref:3-oxoacyl-[acyl-carrier-protein] synthase-3 n=1 Tax=Paenibacillus eucommiae TaxID=1355755 RepID=A0ABS4J330_9BACL|nr:beta-ketoacyl-ACP synthase III [Paenibacillus eucommiae]MBP1993224.1 3-oxoacyl-[acyl-carrier-protein] synthase-3 [Paenibacillus eucommiae]